MPLPSHLEVTMNFAFKENANSCILYYLDLGNGSGVTDQEMENSADAIQAMVGPAFAACMSPATKVNPCTVRWKSGVDYYEAQSTDNPITGSYLPTQMTLEDLLPEECAVVIQRRTNLGGRSKRGRIFVPFVPETLATDSALTEIGLAKYKNVGTKIMQTVEMAGPGIMWTPCTPDWKNGNLHQILHTRVVSEICSRKDRRAPRRPVYYQAPSS
jgi:hypothetical protein